MSNTAVDNFLAHHGIEADPSTDTVDEFLSHHGVKGMRWGHRKSAGSSVDSGASSAPTRKQLRGMNAAARASQKAKAKQEVANNDQAIRDARSNRKASQQAIKAAKQQYKGDKKQIGRVAAKEIMKNNQEKHVNDLLKAGEKTKREQQVTDLIGIGLSLAKILG